MSNIALVISEKEESSKFVNSKFARRTFRHFLYFARKNKLAESVREINMYENLNLYIIRLPFSLTELGFVNKNKIARFIKDECEKREIKSLIIPDEIYNTCVIDGYAQNPFGGKYLYKCLLVNILDDIYLKRGIKIGDLDIVVIKGENDGELYSVVRQLSPLVKYLSILTDSKDGIQHEIDGIFGDYGLSIGISEDFSLAARDADLIINLRNSFDTVKNMKVNPGAVIINYGGKDAVRFFDKGTLINEIEVGLPKKDFLWVDTSISRFFNNVQIAEIVLSHKTGLEDMVSAGIIDCSAAEKISKEFVISGFRISNYIGRYGIIRTGDIRCVKAK
ncbi:MAG TPA: hypothetical protein GXX14_12635 [Clostridiaceae bacterium]|nr:hypothetical protein [Clostridiaceae bacterium]